MDGSTAYADSDPHSMMATLPFRVKAQYDYSSKELDDLNFFNGQVITVTDEEDADWYFGEYEDSTGNKQEGLFPKNFVKIFEPETPPRPSRLSRSKKDINTLGAGGEGRKSDNIEEDDAPSADVMTTSVPFENGRMLNDHVGEEQKQSVRVPWVEARPSASPTNTTTTPAPPITSKLVPHPTAEKPSIGSFRDRINAFNKPAAPPVAPIKPGGLGASGSGFVKKPFVAPPPSKNAYVAPPREPPPRKIYRREEDADDVTQASREDESDDLHAQPQAPGSTDDTEDPPQPTSLKDRIALLQKQQIEQAARHAETGQKKEKPKRPPKRYVEPHQVSTNQEDDAGDEILERMTSVETTGKQSLEVARSSTRSRKSREATPVGSPVAVLSRELHSDPNDADQSGVGDTEDGEELSTGRDDSDGKPPRKNSLPHLRQPQVHALEGNHSGEEGNGAEFEEDEEDNEEEIDPEVKRRMEIRERMAKMSGGMGMAGMFGPPGGMPPRTATKQASGSSEGKVPSNSISGQTESPQSRAPPVPIMPLPGLHRIQSPEQNDPQIEVGKEEAGLRRSIVQGRDPADMPNAEDIEAESLPPSRKSTERPAPPPVPQGNSSDIIRYSMKSMLNAIDRPILPPSQSKGLVAPVPSEHLVPPPSECKYCPSARKNIDD